MPKCQTRCSVTPNHRATGLGEQDDVNTHLLRDAPTRSAHLPAILGHVFSIPLTDPINKRKQSTPGQPSALLKSSALADLRRIPPDLQNRIDLEASAEPGMSYAALIVPGMNDPRRFDVFVTITRDHRQPS